MSQNDLELSRKKLSNAVDRQIGALLKTGPTDLETLHARIRQQYHKVFPRKLRDEFAEAGLKEFERRRLKHIAVSWPDAEATEQQLNLPEMEQFRDIPTTVTFEDRPGHVVYIAYSNTCSAHRKAALALLEKGIAADQKTRDALAKANRFAERLMAKYGDLPLHELVTKWLAQQNKEEAR